jgi:DNA-binding response OmpR family regulator
MASVSPSASGSSAARILALTGRQDVEDLMRSAGVNDFMNKPFSVRELRERVKTAMGAPEPGLG